MCQGDERRRTIDEASLEKVASHISIHLGIMAEETSLLSAGCEA